MHSGLNVPNIPPPQTQMSLYPGTCSLIHWLCVFYRKSGWSKSEVHVVQSFHSHHLIYVLMKWGCGLWRFHRCSQRREMNRSTPYLLLWQMKVLMRCNSLLTQGNTLLMCVISISIASSSWLLCSDPLLLTCDSVARLPTGCIWMRHWICLCPLSCVMVSLLFLNVFVQTEMKDIE